MKKPLIALIFLGLISCGKTNSNETAASDADAPVFITSFDYQPELPEAGKKIGIIELGFFGFNSFIIELDDQDRWKLIKDNYGESFVGENTVTIEHVLAQINEYTSEMIDLGVKSHDINFVASSSAVKNDKVVQIMAEMRKQNIGTITVDAELEGSYALKATIPEAYRRNAYMVDMGSGNTKISWLEKDTIRTIETYGSQYYKDEVADSIVRNEISRIISEIPAINRNICFLVGGIPYQLASKTNSRDGRYTSLDNPEDYQADGYHQNSGLTIYGAIWEEETISYIFDWDSNFSIGVLLEVY